MDSQAFPASDSASNDLVDDRYAAVNAYPGKHCRFAVVPLWPAAKFAFVPGECSKLRQVELAELPELAAFARYKGELGGGPERNNGEAAGLAWGSVNGGVRGIGGGGGRAL